MGRVIQQLTAVAILSILSSLGAAQEPAGISADELVKRAVEFRRNGDHASALTLLQRAYAVQPADARTTVQLGLAEYALGRWAEAEDHLVAGLRQSDDPWIASNRPTVLQSLQVVRRHVGSLEITGEPTGADVFVNGKQAGYLPLDQVVRVNAGTAYVEARAAGYHHSSQTVRVMPANVQPVVIHLEKETTVSAAPVAVANLPRTRSPNATATKAADVGHPTRSLTVAKFVLAASALVGAGVAAYGFVRHEKLVDDFRQRRDATNHPRCFEDGNRVVDANGMPAMADCSSLRSSYTSAQKTMVVGLVAAGLLSGAAVTLWILDSRQTSSVNVVASNGWACAPWDAPFGLTCATAF